MSDTPNGETANAGNSKTTEPTTTAPVQGNAVDKAEVERLRKEADQARMRAQQLENELRAKQDAEEAAKAKQLEENNEYKALYEQNQAKLNELLTQREREEKQAQITAGTNEVFSTFPTEVVEVAKEAGLGLSDVTEEAKVALKERLERIQAKVVKDSTPNPNNPNTSNSQGSIEQKMEVLRYGTNQERRQAKDELIGGLDAVKAMKQMAGYSDK